jgi:hypothetical protein
LPTRNNYRTALGILFSFALRRGYVLKNPATLAERAKVKAGKPAILTVAEARALIENADADFIPAVALVGLGRLLRQNKPQGRSRTQIMVVTQRNGTADPRVNEVLPTTICEALRTLLREC